MDYIDEVLYQEVAEQVTRMIQAKDVDALEDALLRVRYHRLFLEKAVQNLEMAKTTEERVAKALNKLRGEDGSN